MNSPVKDSPNGSVAEVEEIRVSLKDVVWTPVHSKILSILDDGKSHPLEELKTASHPLSTNTVATVHISAIRKKLRMFGHDIICEYKYPKSVVYRHVITLTKPIITKPIR